RDIEASAMTTPSTAAGARAASDPPVIFPPRRLHDAPTLHFLSEASDFDLERREGPDSIESGPISPHLSGVLRRFWWAVPPARSEVQLAMPRKPPRPYDYRWKKVRLRILARDGYQCYVLGCTIPATQVDHIVPVTEAPHLRLEPSNLRSSCAKHNAGRAN